MRKSPGGRVGVILAALLATTLARADERGELARSRPPTPT
jgi:hypothetical protein